MNIITASAIVRQARRVTLRPLSEILKIPLGATQTFGNWTIDHGTCLCVVGSGTDHIRTTGRLRASVFAVEVDFAGRWGVSLEGYHCRWNWATSFWYWEQTAKFGVEISGITNTKIAEVVASAGNVMVILFSDIQGLCISMWHQRTQL